MNKKALTITIVANMTSNYSESLGNIASVQKVFRNRKVYTIRSRESLKNAIMTQSGLYEDLKTEIDGAVQKKVTEESNASNCRALEGGYMNTSGTTYIRNSSFYVTDAISCESFVSQPRFHNNLYMATNYAKENGLNVQNHADQVGLMPYQYEYDKSLKIYSITIDLEMVGKDDNFQEEAEAEEAINIVKTKRFGMKPMFPEDACVEMELLGHNFYMFLNAETDQVNVVYKRKNHTYGLIEPEF